MIRVSAQQGRILISASEGDFLPRHESQLAYWMFSNCAEAGSLSCDGPDPSALASKVVRYFDAQGLQYSLGEGVQALLLRRQAASQSLQEAIAAGRQFKDGTVDRGAVQGFSRFLSTSISRPLKDHQVKAALHLLRTRNGANFSVPGSGKTAVVLAVFRRLRQMGEVDALFVVGPPACFGPWRTEYEAVLGVKPSLEILAGGNVDERRSKYLANEQTARDIYLTTFQTLHRDSDRVRIMFEQQGIRFYFVVDEAHYVKQIDGAWANAVLAVSRHAARRCILTGTPFPRGYSDAFNLFDVLWPNGSAIPANERHRIEWHTERNELKQAAEILDARIGPLFYRVRKVELGLAPQMFHEPVRIRMNPYEQQVYDAVLGRILDLSQFDSHRSVDLLFRLRRGRMIRLRQCVSYARLLGTAVAEYEEDLTQQDFTLSEVIARYDELERPAKLDALLSLVQTLHARGEKVVIWSNFIRTLQLLSENVASIGSGVGLIYGATPIQEADARDELTRERIIEEFCRPDSGMDVLVANPAACAESISLHKTCSHAIYYDLSYNCAQYLQSLDRIHRVGGSEDKESHYHFLQYEGTIDGDVLGNLERKAANMSAIIDKDYAVYSLDMFAEDDEQEAYERLFGSKHR